MAEKALTRRRFVGTAAAAAGWYLAPPPRPTCGDETTTAGAADGPIPNAPIGTAKGLKPGRVAWVHEPNATRWEGPGHGHWWESAYTNAAVIDQMMSGALRELVGEDRDQSAWDRLFRHFNEACGKGNVG